MVAEAIERYLASLNRSSDALLDTIAEEGRKDELPLIDAEVGALLHVLARAVGARRILEIGTAIGYSGIWLARALEPDGALLTIECDAGRAEAARRNFDRAGLADRANVMVGDAARMVHKVAGPFDLIFNDGDKAQYEPLLDRLVTLLRPGGLLVTDNVLWSGRVVPGFDSDAPERPVDTEAIAWYNQRLARDDRLITSVLPLRDGVAISVKR
jgi:predicted O-methyltransferase YrrM